MNLLFLLTADYIPKICVNKPLGSYWGGIFYLLKAILWADLTLLKQQEIRSTYIHTAETASVDLAVFSAAVWPRSAAVVDDGSVQRGGGSALRGVGLAAHLCKHHVNAAAASSHSYQPRPSPPDWWTNSRQAGHKRVERLWNCDILMIFCAVNVVWYGDGVSNAVKENSDIFLLIWMSSAKAFR